MAGARLEDVAETISTLSRELAAALDDADVLERTAATVAGVLPLSGLALYAVDGTELRLVAGSSITPTPGPSHSVPLRGADRELGELVAQPARSEGFSAMEAALLDAVAAQVAAAVERGRRFREVMELERLKIDFISRVSHELRTPITIVSGFLDTMLAHDDRLGAAQRRHMLERARAASSRLGRLIEELLVLSRIEAGVLTPEQAEVGLGEVLDAVRQGADEPGQVVAVAPDAMVVTDRVLLSRALGLVVDNALKYGGTAEVVASVDGPVCRFDVRDRGPGFGDDVRDSAFEMFTRGRTTTSVPGLGVGLPIARTLVELLDGRIEIVDTEEGPGALVRVTLGE